MNDLQRLVEHLAWADERCLGSIKACRTPLAAPISLYAHILGAEAVWLSRIEGVHPPLPIWPEMSLAECEAATTENIARLRSFVSAISEDARQKQITYRNSAGNQFTNAIEDILLHVCLHGSYHRGQIAAILRSSGDVPSPTDYIVWLRAATGPTKPEK